MVTILVVEDDEDQRFITARYLANLGYNVLEAENGQTAMEIVKSTHIDVLFTDFVMPGRVRSIDLARATRYLHPECIVIFTSGYPLLSTDIIPDAIVVDKPYRIDQVDALIQREIKDLQIKKSSL